MSSDPIGRLGPGIAPLRPGAGPASDARASAPTELENDVGGAPANPAYRGAVRVDPAAATLASAPLSSRKKQPLLYFDVDRVTGGIVWQIQGEPEPLVRPLPEPHAERDSTIVQSDAGPVTDGAATGEDAPRPPLSRLV